jgi:DNA polymerase-3 subunit epsilon
MAGKFQISNLSEDGGDSIVLRRFRGKFSPPSYWSPQWAAEHQAEIALGAAVDVETTGLDFNKEKIIELGLRLFSFHKNTGEVLEWKESYCEFEDPGFKLSPEIIQVTGITDEMLSGKKIDWPKVTELLKSVDLVIAHNAGFDRPFLERYSEIFKSKIWGCTYNQIDWKEKGFPTSKLEVLSLYHGFFVDAHRALEDVDAMLYLVSKKPVYKQ